MKTIAAHTFGCKVNQYDTQAMLELFQHEGFHIVTMDQPADVYLVNTCTVTGVGDKKSLQLIRKILREHPSSFLIVCGCMAQHRGHELMTLGADLVIGTQRRTEVVSLYKQVAETGRSLCAVSPLSESISFEQLCVSSQNDRTRAVLKIQEGCNNHCSYCIIPDVRGPIRSRPLDEVRAEALRLSQAGYRELVLTGIHLCSYGLDFSSSVSLLDAIRTVQHTEGVIRIRLGSLEPSFATDDFASELSHYDKVCPQFHLALQSGSNDVLARMRRRYNTDQFLRAVENLRRFFPHAAITTDILTGFPGETEKEFLETADFIRKVGFARIHVFPFSPRPGTPAASLPNQLSSDCRESRARQLIALGRSVSECYLKSWIGEETVVLPEENIDGVWEGYSPEYVRVYINGSLSCRSGELVRVRLSAVDSRGMRGIII